jgi:UrcA family protein
MPKFAKIATLTLGLAALALPAAAQNVVGGINVRAQPRGQFDVRSQAVNFGDIDVHTPDGAHRLLMRVSRAAEDVCTPAPVGARNIAELNDTMDYQRCKSDSIHLALAQIDTPAVASLSATLR